MSEDAFDQPGAEGRPAEEVQPEPSSDEPRDEVAPPTTDNPGDATPAAVLDDDVPPAPEVAAVAQEVAAEPDPEPVVAEEPATEPEPVVAPEPVFTQTAVLPPLGAAAVDAS